MKKTYPKEIRIDGNPSITVDQGHCCDVFFSYYFELRFKNLYFTRVFLFWEYCTSLHCNTNIIRFTPLPFNNEVQLKSTVIFFYNYFYLFTFKSWKVLYLYCSALFFPK